MDVLNANKYAVKGRVYRRNIPLDAVQGFATVMEQLNLHDSDDDYDSDPDFEEANVDNVADEIVEEKPTINKTNEMPPATSSADRDRYGIVYNKRKRAFLAEINFPEDLMGRLIGTKGSTKKSIEETTGAKIDIPRRGVPGPVGIASPSRESVERCYECIESIILDGRKRVPLTHFVMFPASVPHIVKAHEKLIDSIQRSTHVDDACKQAALFMPSPKLHLTIVPLWLFGEKEINAAKTIIDEAVSGFSAGNSGDVKVTLKGLSYFGDEDPKSVRVVYAKPVNSPKVQKLAELVCSNLVKAGYGLEPRDGVKLHLTIMNTRYLGSDDSPKQFIDATELFKQFGHVEYGTISINQVHLCSMSQIDANTGSYPVIHTSYL